mmetsp:Transcript_10524/g.9287  ORF Transcript_10524/g.9287 Transcript_10524/m.9287 type:complete len:135 (-) Transcript_10524:971-1375(-)
MESKVGGFFNEESVISGLSGDKGNFGKAHYSDGEMIIEFIMDAVRKEVEKSDSVEGFQYVMGIGGGTGSGLGSKILSQIREYYPDKVSDCYPIFPSVDQETEEIGIINSILFMNYCVENCDIYRIANNQGLYQS